MAGYHTIAVMVPSRGRPRNIDGMLEAWDHTATGPAEMFVCVDDDDPTLDEYRAIELPLWARLFVGPSERLGGALNRVAHVLAEFYDQVGFMGDDHRPRTEGWPCDIEAAFAPGSVVYGNDLIQGAALPTAVFLDARIVRTLGHFVLPGQQHLWMDNYWKTLGEQLGTLRYLPDVVIEHLHPIAGKAEWDEHYTANNSAATWEHDEALYKEWVAHQMPHDVARIREALRG